tara:strand:- start:230 stop:364 length:135 start_codon:yes stop_codon:yes gene_type:complete
MAHGTLWRARLDPAAAQAGLSISTGILEISIHFRASQAKIAARA